MSSTTSSVSTPVSLRGPKVDFSNPSPLVTVTVGSGSRAKDFTIHQEIIRFYSPYFCKLFESGLLSVKMPAVDVQSFGLLTHWLYTQEIRLGEQSLAKKSMNVLTTHLLPLAKLWNLARRCEIPGLQNSVMDRIAPILDHISIQDVSTFIIHIYNDNETEGTQIRALAIYHAAHHMTPEVLKELADLAPREMLFEISMAFLEHNDLVHNSDRYETADPARFHVGIPETEEDLLDIEATDPECEEPKVEEDDETALHEQSDDECVEIAEQIKEIGKLCGEDFEGAETTDEDPEEDEDEDFDDN